MKKVKCENQSRFMLGLGFVFWTVYIADQFRFMSVFGYSPLLLFLNLLILVFCVLFLFAFVNSLSEYTFDEDQIEKKGLARRKNMRWTDVVNMKIKRSGGDSQIGLQSRTGSKLWLDFQLMGNHGKELFDDLTQKLKPLIDSKVQELENQEVAFRKKFANQIPFPDFISAGVGKIKSHGLAGSKEFSMQDISEVKVRDIRRLTPTQEYTLRSDGKEIHFQSSLENSPFLILYLKSKIPEERWRLTKSSNVVRAKLLTVIMVIALVWSALSFLGVYAPRIGTDVTLSHGAEHARATVVDVQHFHGRLYIVLFVFKTPDGNEVNGEGLISGASDTLPEIGSEIPVLYSKDSPYENKPEESDTVKPFRASSHFFEGLILVLVSIPYLISVLAFKPREDPFLSWF